MRVWSHPIESFTAHEVQVFAVQNMEWQRFRITLKGLSTEDKLDKLDQFRAERNFLNSGLDRKWQVAIDNYLQALYRGGLIRPMALSDSIRDAGKFEVVR